MTVHAATIDYSPETGSIVACTCGLTLGPFHEYREARKAAAEHRRWTRDEDRRRERERERTARQAAARRAARERAAEVEGRS